LPESIIQQVGADIVKGLLQQLNSMPCEILAAEHCYREHQSLRTEQEYAINEELGVNKSALSLKIKSTMPADIFDKNAIMNATFALWWGKLTEQMQVFTPYNTLGYHEKAENLINLLDQVHISDKNQYQQLVNLWAEQLGLSDNYEWLIRKG